MNYLMEKGAPVDQTDKSGRTALHWAVISGHKEATDILLAKVNCAICVDISRYSLEKGLRTVICVKIIAVPASLCLTFYSKPVPHHSHPPPFPFVHTFFVVLQSTPWGVLRCARHSILMTIFWSRILTSFPWSTPPHAPRRPWYISRREMILQIWFVCLCL